MWHTGRYDIHTDTFEPGVATFGPDGKIIRAETPDELLISVAAAQEAFAQQLHRTHEPCAIDQR